MGVALSELGRRTKRRGVSAPGPTRGELDAFCEALSQSTGLGITPYAAPRYDRLLRRLHLGEVELAWLPPVVALSALRDEALPVALPVRGETPWFWTALFTGPDSEIRTLADLRRARAVWVAGDSASGYLVIRAALRAEGFDPDRGFESERFTESHEDVVRAVLADPRAVGATYMHLDADGELLRAGWGGARVRELKRAGPIPGDVLAAAKNLPPHSRTAIARALETPDDELLDAMSTLFSAKRFVPAERAHLAHLEALGRYLIRERR